MTAVSRKRDVEGLDRLQCRLRPHDADLAAGPAPHLGGNEDGRRGSHRMDISAHMENDHVAMHNTAVL